MKTIITSFLCVVLSLNLMAAETLSFKFSNPRVESYAPDNYLVFDVLVKASANGTYLYSAQVNCNIELSNFNTSIDPFVVKGFIDGTYDPPPNPPFTPLEKYSVIANYNSGNLNISVLANNSLNAYLVNGHSPVTTSWQTLCTVWCTISNASGVAGISFQPVSMNGQQKYATSTGPLYSAEYNNPNLYEGYDFTDLYLARIFSGTSGWTQVDGAVDWTASVNTSVWDTATAAAVVGDDLHPNAVANNLTIHPGARLIIPAGRSLTCNGDVIIKETTGMVLSAGSSGMGQFLDKGTITYHNNGSVKAQSYFAMNKWHHYCIPVTSTVAMPYLNLYMKYYVESAQKWKYVNAPDSLLNKQMLGYTIWADNTVSGIAAPVGQLNTGTISIPVSKNSTYAFNLVGNPYPSAIDLSQTGVSWGTCETKAWFFDPVANNYFVYIKGGASTRATSYCAPQQGFFVLAGSTGTFGLDNTVRTINSEAFLKNDEYLPEMIQLNVTSSANSFYDIAVVHFSNEATSSYDEKYDAYKLSGEYLAPQLFSVLPDTRKVSVNTLPWTGQNEIVPLGFGCGESSTYTITGSNFESFAPNISLLLEDKKQNFTQNLRENPVYSFTAIEGEDLNRFVLHFANPTFGINDQPGSMMQVYTYGEALYVRNLNNSVLTGEVMVYDMLGKKVFEDHLTNNSLSTYNMNLKKGCYLAKVISGTDMYVQKVIF